MALSRYLSTCPIFPGVLDQPSTSDSNGDTGLWALPPDNQRGHAPILVVSNDIFRGTTLLAVCSSSYVCMGTQLPYYSARRPRGRSLGHHHILYQRRFTHQHQRNGLDLDAAQQCRFRLHRQDGGVVEGQLQFCI